MAVCTLKAHVSRALDFYNKESIYFAIGKYTVWKSGDFPGYNSSINYDINPPVPTNTSDMSEIIGYKKAEFKALVVQDNNGSLEYRGTKWRVVSPSDAIAEGARWVFVSTGLAYQDFAVEASKNVYRKVGVYTGLVPKSGISEATYALLPSQVQSQGLLEVIDFRKPVYRDTDVREKLKIVLEF